MIYLKLSRKKKDSFLTAPKDIANLFNKFFCSVTPNIQSKTSFAHKSLLFNLYFSSGIFQDKLEIAKIVPVF